MLTQQQKIDIWAEKDRLTEELSFTAEEEKQRRTELHSQIEFCNKQLVQERMEPVENSRE